MQDTFVVDEKNKKKARLSWYHPDDTVCLRDPALLPGPLQRVAVGNHGIAVNNKGNE